jgi:hypothetical protein
VEFFEQPNQLEAKVFWPPAFILKPAQIPFTRTGSLMAAQIQLRQLGILAMVALLLTAAGCGGSNRGPTLKVTPVKGKVTLGTDPLADAQVSFTFQGQAPKDYLGSGAKTDAQGNFEIMTGAQKGVPAGTYTVTVSKVVDKNGKPFVNDPASGMDQAMMEASGDVVQLIPPTFNDPAQSQTKVTVTDGTPVPDVVISIPK